MVNEDSMAMSSASRIATVLNIKEIFVINKLY